MAKKTSNQWREYKNALLYNKVDAIVDCENRLLSSRNGTTDDFVFAREWGQKCRELFDQAQQLANEGFTADSMEYDQLECQARDLECEFEASGEVVLALQGAFEGDLEIGDTTEPIAGPPKQALESMLKSYLNLLVDVRNQPRIIAQRVLILDTYPESGEKVAEIARVAEKMNTYSKKAQSLGFENRPESELNQLIHEMKTVFRNYPDYINKCYGLLHRSYNLGVQTGNNGQNGQRIKAGKKGSRDDSSVNSTQDSGKTEQRGKTDRFSTSLPVKPMRSPDEINVGYVHQNYLGHLAPAPEWTVLIDETQGDFSDKSDMGEMREVGRGCIVAVAVPCTTSLPDLPLQWHTLKESTDRIHDVVNTLLNSQCGVLGITSEAIRPCGASHRWFQTIECLLDFLVRLLPVDGPVKIRLLVERRAEIDVTDTNLLRKTWNDCVYHLSRTNPIKADMITVTSDIIQKGAHPWQGYPDTVAYCWKAKKGKRYLPETQWLDTCLLEHNADQLQNALDFFQYGTVTAQQWSDLLYCPDAANPCSLVSALMDGLGKEAKNNTETWNQYLDWVQVHLYSRSIDMLRLGAEINWLKAYCPSESCLTPRTRLMWLTTQLARYNHLGNTEIFMKYHEEFSNLCRQVYAEDAPLVCLATLHIAVAFMNRFDFQSAHRAIEKWLQKDEAIPGRQYYGQVLSTVGQLNAFTGHLPEAIKAFSLAIEKFEQLTDTRQTALDVSQTLSYKVIAMMDSNPVPSNMISELERYLGTTLTEAALELAGADSPGTMYYHYVLIRYMVLNPESECVRVYMGEQSRWKTGDGHPWELIEFHRALLTEDIESRKELLRSAFDIAVEGEMKLQLIACVILGSLYYYDPTCKGDLIELTKKVIQGLPNLGRPRIIALENQIFSPVPPLELAKSVLPFYYR